MDSIFAIGKQDTLMNPYNIVLIRLFSVEERMVFYGHMLLNISYIEICS